MLQNTKNRIFDVIKIPTLPSWRLKKIHTVLGLCVRARAFVCVCMHLCISQEIFPIQIVKLTDRRHINKQTSYGQERKAGGEREESAELPPGWGVASPLSLTGGCRGKRAVSNSGVSNGIRRCLCHHGDGAVPREVVMG